MQHVVHRVEQMKEQAAQEQKQLHQQLMLVNAQQLAVLENTQSTGNLGK
jgi:hypothetical protein